MAQTEYTLAQHGREFLITAASGTQLARAISTQQTRAATRAFQKILEIEKGQKRYAQEIQAANEMKKLYLRQMRVILRSLEDMDKKRMACFKDALRKFMVYQTSWLRNIQYDLDITITAIEELNEEEETKEFVERNQLALGVAPKPLDVPDLVAKHWGVLSMSPVPEPAPAENSAHFPPVEAAKTLLKGTPLDKVMQVATARLSSMGLTAPAAETDSSLNATAATPGTGPIPVIPNTVLAVCPMRIPPSAVAFL